MVTGEQSKSASEKRVRRVRARRASVSGSEQKLRDRTLWEVIQITNMLERAGMLCEKNEFDENYEDLAARELAVKLQISVSGAKRVLKLKLVERNKESWEFLKESSMLSVFADSQFTKGYASIKTGGGTLSIEFLESFMNGEVEKDHEEKLTRRARSKKLDAISLCFCTEARDLCVSMFFKIVAVISTLSSFLCPGTKIDRMKLLDLTGRYLGDNWASPSMQREYQTASNLMSLVDGWNLVNEAMKVQVQELMFWKGGQRGEMPALERDVGPKKADPNSSRTSRWITEEDVRGKVFQICCHVVAEFFAWCFQFLPEEEEVAKFLDSIMETMDNICIKLTESIGVDVGEDDEIPDGLVQASVEKVANGHPTMAEIRYDAKEMTPSKREARLNASNRVVTWTLNDILMRCRWDSSVVKEVYKCYLSRAEMERPSNDEKPSETEATKVKDSPAPQIYGSPRYADNLSSKDMSVPGTPEHNNDVASKKRNYREIGEYGTSRYGEGHSSKRVKKILLSTSRRLYQSTTKDRIMRGMKLKEGYLDDGEASDEERQPGNVEDNRFQNKPPDENMEHATNLSVELLYETILDWPVMPVPITEIEKDRHRLLPPFDQNNPVTKAERSAVSDLLLNDLRWADIYCKSRHRNFLDDVSLAKAEEEYAAHWRHIIPIEIRAMISESVANLFPKKKENPELEWSKEVPKESLVLLRVHTVSLEKGSINTVCKSLQPRLNKEIAIKMQGGSVCVGYIEGERDVYVERGKRLRRKQFSDPVLFICRRVHWDNDDVVPLADADYVEDLEIHMCVGRERTRNVQGVWENDLVRVMPICPLSPHLRMFRAVHETHRLPSKLQNIIFGHECPPVPSDDVLHANIDTGCMDYLTRVRMVHGTIDDSQLSALKMFLGNIGSAAQNSSSFSLIKGPPGTGKTTLLNVLIGALLHHSSCGHIGRPQVHKLRKEMGEDGILRHSVNQYGLRILVCCGSNQAVDNVLSKIHESGIPDGSGGKIRPQAVRLARQGYEYGKLQEYAIDVKALPFDTFLHHKNERKRMCASNKARTSFAEEVIIAFATHSSCGGARLKNLKVGWDVVLIDEACQSSEPETLIPITASTKRGIHGRCHVISSGDPGQLSPIVLAEMLMRKTKHSFNYSKQMESLFERLQNQGRAPFKMLTNQYRMHPVISRMHSEIFYNGAVKSPLPSAAFLEPYNLGWDDSTGRFSPVTLIDTSAIPTRFEWNDQKGSVSNDIEVELINEVLNDIKRLAGEGFKNLRNEIAVLVPYRAQVKNVRRFLMTCGKYKEHGGESREGFEILVGTVDAMQGSQRDIVIFAATRSNPEQILGFVNRPNRLNVAVSRASKLLVIIADMSTLFASEQFTRFWKYVAPRESPGALVLRKVGRNGNATGTAVEVSLNSEQVSSYLQRRVR